MEGHAVDDELWEVADQVEGHDGQQGDVDGQVGAASLLQVSAHCTLFNLANFAIEIQA